MSADIKTLYRSLRLIEIDRERIAELNAQLKQARENLKSTRDSQRYGIQQELDAMTPEQVRGNLDLVAAAGVVNAAAAGRALTRILPETVTCQGFGNETKVFFRADYLVKAGRDLETIADTIEAVMRVADQLYSTMKRINRNFSFDINPEFLRPPEWLRASGLGADNGRWYIFGRFCDPDITIDQAVKIMREMLFQRPDRNEPSYHTQCPQSRITPAVNHMTDYDRESMIEGLRKTLAELNKRMD